MKSKLFTSFAAGLVIAAFGASPAVAQASCTTNACALTQTVSATIPPFLKMTLGANTFALTAPAITDFAADSTATKTEASTFNVTVISNKPYNVSLQGAAWTAPWVKPVSDLSYNVDGGSYSTVTTSAVNLYGSSQGLTFAGRPAAIGFKTHWDFIKDVPGAYSMILTYSLSAP
jgi:hypothetical protein